jgi:hypothetical protein
MHWAHIIKNKNKVTLFLKHKVYKWTKTFVMLVFNKANSTLKLNSFVPQSLPGKKRIKT